MNWLRKLWRRLFPPVLVWRAESDSGEILSLHMTGVATDSEIMAGHRRFVAWAKEKQCWVVLVPDAVRRLGLSW